MHVSLILALTAVLGVMAYPGHVDNVSTARIS
jgi:hypothetical protein